MSDKPKRIQDYESSWSHLDKTEEEISTNLLEIDPQVQRKFINERKVQHLVKFWNHTVVGRVLVSRRKDGSYRVLDGLHRTLAWRRLSDDKGVIPCEVYEGLTLEQEAQIFLDKNAGDKPTLIDRYNVGVVAGRHVEVEVDKIVHAFGFAVAKYAKDARSKDGGTASGTLNCVAALQKLYVYSEDNDHEPNLLLMALKTITQVWGDDRNALQGHFITALGRIFGEYGSKLEYDHLVQVLRRYRGGVTQLNIVARQQATTKNWRLPMALADLIVEEYNKGLGEKRALPRWRRRT